MSEENIAATHNFKDFTNKFPLTKTLRFELVPEFTEEELRNIQEKKGYNSVACITRQDKIEHFFELQVGRNVLDRDIERANAFKVFKLLVTELHARFIEEVLSAASSDTRLNQLEVLIKALEEYIASNDEAEKKVKIAEINKIKKELAEALKKYFYNFTAHSLETKGAKWKLKQLLGGKDPVIQHFEDYLEEDLHKEFQGVIEREQIERLVFSLKGDHKNAFAFFAKWKTYTRPFYDIRALLYGHNGFDVDADYSTLSKGDSIQITSRILDDNAVIFTQNRIKIERQCKSDKNRKKIHLNDLLTHIGLPDGVNPFAPQYFIHTLSQKQIDAYNQYVAAANTFLQERIGKDATFLKKLNKQMLGVSEGESTAPRFIEIDSLAQLHGELWEPSDRWGGVSFVEFAYTKAHATTLALRNCKLSSEEQKEIIFDTNKLSFFSNVLFGSWNVFKDGLRQYDELCKHNTKQERGTCKYIGHEIFNRFCEDNEISLFDLSCALNTLTVDGVDEGGSKKVCFAELLRQRARQANFSLPERVFANLHDSGDVAETFIRALAVYHTQLIDGRDWQFLSERNGNSCDVPEPDSVSLRVLKERLEMAHSRIDCRAKDTPKREHREMYFKALNHYLSRINEINKFFLLFALPEGVKFTTNVGQIVRGFDAQGSGINRMFDVVRNYVTKRLVVHEKIKLTFDDQLLLSGWDISDSDTKGGLIFKNENEYYLGIFSSKTILQTLNNTTPSSGKWERAHYHFFKDAFLMIPKCTTQLQAVRKHFEQSNDDYLLTESKIGKFVRPLVITKEVFDLNNYEYAVDYLSTLNEGEELDKSQRLRADSTKQNQVKLFQKKFLEQTGNVKIYRKALETWIRFCKDFLSAYPSTGNGSFDFSRLKDESEYEDIGQFYSDVDKCTYKIRFTPVDQKVLVTGIRSNTLYLFQIYNKDFSKKKKANTKQNLHTLYFKELFSNTNELNPLFRLAGGAEIFFRDALPTSEWEYVPDEELCKPKTDKKPLRKRRFTERKILFHVPIEINGINQGERNINGKVQEYIRQHDNVCVIGIDRGEKHLAYYCAVDENGDIVRDGTAVTVDLHQGLCKLGGQTLCGTLNTVGVRRNTENNRFEPVDYQKCLDQRDRERQKSRKEWMTVENIKDLKKGYISQVVHKIAHMAVDNNAIIAMEDLNFGFKQGRIRIEKSIYQQLENALLEKLQYFVREKTPEGIRNALQLMGKLQPHYKWGKQQGIVFYVDAKFTSKTCPNCGWRKRRTPEIGKISALKDAALKDKTCKLFYEPEHDRFRFEYEWQYEDAGAKRTSDRKLFIRTCDILGAKTDIIYSDVDRSWYDKTERVAKPINPTNSIKRALGAIVLSGENLLTEENKEKISWDLLSRALKGLMNLRFDDPARDQDDTRRDVIQCPKCHFDTRQALFLINADAVGAYNIARRGLITLQKIRGARKKFLVSSDLAVHLKDWDQYTFQQWNKREWSADQSRI